MDLGTWIRDDHARAGARFGEAVAAHVPTERWRERPGGGASIAGLLLHLSHHQDLAMAVAAGDRDALFASWQGALGLPAAPGHTALSEAEEVAVTTALDLDALAAYAAAVHTRTADLLAAPPDGWLDVVPDASTRLEELGVTATAVPWLHRMWSGRATAWLVGWEAIGHVHAHVGEMVAIRGRLGLSPF